MFELEREVRRWRRHLERGSSLSPRELDELEDHLRARVDLELELNSALIPSSAFAVAADEIGEPSAISREFAKVGTNGYRWILLAAWILFAVSFFLPVWDGEPGWRAFEGALRYGGILGRISALTNVLMLFSIAAAFGRRRRWLPRILAAAAVLNLGYWPIIALVEGDSPAALQAGYWAWAISFLCVAATVWWRGRAWASARPKQSIA